MSSQWSRSISWSKLNTYNTCPRQFKFKYVDDLEEEEEDQRMQDGIKFHEYMELYYDVVGSRPEPEDAVDLAREMFHEGDQARYKQWIQQWHQFNEWLYEKWGEEHWKPILTEEWVEVEIGDHTHHGYIDAIHWDPDRQSYGVVDYKPKARTGSRIKGQTAYYADFLLEVAELLDGDVDWAGTYGYKDGQFESWKVHWASRKATKRKIDSLIELDNGYEPDWGFHCQFCQFVDACYQEEEETDNTLLNP